MKRKFNWLLVVLLAFSFTSAPSPSQASTDYSHIRKAANSVLVDYRFKKSNTSVTIREAKTGKIVYYYYPDKAVTPASTMKLFTGASALDLLGQDHRFSTTMWTNGKQISKTLHGSIYLKGGGDPTLLQSDLANFAKQLKARGIVRINGKIVGDDYWFDKQRTTGTIQPEDEPYYYAAQISGLTLSPNTDYDAGSVIVSATPSSVGARAKISLEPMTGVMSIVNQTKTVPKGYANTVKIKRKRGTNTIVVTGNIPSGAAAKKEWISVVNPTTYTLDVFKRALLAEGIHFAPQTGQIAVGRKPTYATLLSTKDSQTVGQLMPIYMKLSNNTIAETFVKEIGKQHQGVGSWEAGLSEMRAHGASLGLDMSKWKFEDGSGLSYNNRLTSREVSELLYVVRQKPWAGIFQNSLPLAGINHRLTGGTLRYRLTHSATKGITEAKTGSLDNVKSLAGYTHTGDGEELIFTILTDQNPSNMIPVIDKLVITLSSAKRP